MKELKCPKCGNVFQVDEADYASILSQVKNKEFEYEIQARLKEIDKQNKLTQEANELKQNQKHQQELNEKEQYWIRYYNAIKDGYNETVDHLRQVKEKGASWLMEIEAKEREKTGIKNLKIKYNKVFGYKRKVILIHQ